MIINCIYTIFFSIQSMYEGTRVYTDGYSVRAQPLLHDTIPTSFPLTIKGPPESLYKRRLKCFLFYFFLTLRMYKILEVSSNACKTIQRFRTTVVFSFTSFMYMYILSCICLILKKYQFNYFS